MIVKRTITITLADCSGHTKPGRRRFVSEPS